MKNNNLIESKYWTREDARYISIEEKNKSGTSTEQIKERMKSYIIRFNRLPSSKDGGDGSTLWSILRLKYGNVNDGLIALDLPIRKQKGSHVEYLFKDGTIIKCGLNHNNYDKLIHKIKTESSLFKKSK